MAIEFYQGVQHLITHGPQTYTNMVELHESFPSHFLRVGLHLGLKIYSLVENLALYNEYRNLKPDDVEMGPYIIDLPDFPADAPQGCPHVLDLSQIDLTDDTIPISFPDIIATVLYNFDKKYLEVFMDVDGSDYEQVEFKIPGAILEDEKGLLVLTRELEYVVVRRASTSPDLLHPLPVQTSLTSHSSPKAKVITPTPPTADSTADKNWNPDIIDRYMFSIRPNDPHEPWILEEYSHGLRARSSTYEDLDRALPAYEVNLEDPIKQKEVPWLNDFGLRALLAKRCWEDGSVTATGWVI